MRFAQKGNALALTLTVLLVATLLVSALMVGSGQSGNSANQKMAKMQARYMAESAIRLEAWKLGNIGFDTTIPSFLTSHSSLAIPNVWMDSNDFWLRLGATGTFKNQRATVIAELGMPLNPDAFRYGLRVLDTFATEERFSIRTQDSVMVGPWAGKVTSLQLLEQLLNMPSALVEHWNARLHNEFSPDTLKNCTQGCLHGSQHFSGANDFASLPIVRVSTGDLSLEFPRATTVHGTHILAVQGSVELHGDVTFDTLIILAEGAVHVRGNISAKRLTLVSKGRVTLDGTGRMEVRVFAQGDLRIMGNMEFSPWSFLTTYPPQDSTAGRGDILLLDKTRFTGYAICASTSSLAPQAPMADEVGIYIAPQARAYGVVASLGSIQNEGFLGGMAITHKLSCNGKPNINCAGNGQFNRDSLPAGFLQVPSLNFGEARSIAAVRWTEL